MSSLPCNFPASVVGDPVDTFSGAVLERKLEFRLIGPLELAWWRHYDSSQCGTRFTLGWGQAHDFDRILYLGDDSILYGSAVGQLVAFPLLDRNGSEARARGYTLQLKAAGRFELHRHGEPSMEFVFVAGGRRARPRRLFTPIGEILLYHTPKNRLERIVHSTGVSVLATTTDAGLLSRLTLHGGNGNDELLLEYTYDDRGNLIATRNASGHGYAFTYDHANRMLHRRGRKGFTFRYKYDGQGRCVLSVGDSNSYGIALQYDDGRRATAVRRPDNGIWQYRFFPTGKLAEIRDPLGGSQKFLYDEVGNLSYEVDPNANITQYIYDAAGTAVAKVLPTGRKVALPEDPNGPYSAATRVAGNAVEFSFGWLLDAPSRRLPSAAQLAALALPPRARDLATTRPDNDEVSARATRFKVAPLGFAWWPPPNRGRIFNDLGKLVEQRDDAGRVRRWSYDASGNLATYVDFDGGVWQHDYGRWHLLLGRVSPIGAETRFSYTTNERIASCMDPGRTLSEYRYDQKDQLTEVRRHGVIRETYKCDVAGNIVAKYGADGRELLRREVGKGNRLTRRILARGDEHRFTYDEAGRLTLIATREDCVERAYGAAGPYAAELRNGLGIEHRFNGWQTPIETVYLGCFTVRVDRSSTTAIVIQDPTGGRHVVERRGHGVVQRSFASGTVETMQFDTLGRCLFKNLERHRGEHWSRRYYWSGEGELLRVEDSRFGEVRHEYDAAHRLRGRLLHGRHETYEFDNADNLLAQPGLRDVVLRDGNRLAAANGARFEYNDRNHVSRRDDASGSTEYIYDGRDQLVEVRTPAGKWTAAYDAIGRRTRKSWQGAATEYYWQGDQLVAQVAPDGGVRLYVYADHLALTPLLIIDYASLDMPPEDGRVYSVISDQLGTPLALEDAHGSETWRATVAPFGAADVATNARLTLALRFPGHYADPEIGLHYNRFRHYDPVLGRYLQSDPWGIAGGNNLYAYRVNPLLSADVRGLGEEGTPCPPAREGQDDGEQPLPGGQPRGREPMTDEQLQSAADHIRQGRGFEYEDGARSVTVTQGMVDGDPVFTVSSMQGGGLTMSEQGRAQEVFGPNGVTHVTEPTQPLENPGSNHSEQRGARATPDQEDRVQATSNASMPRGDRRGFGSACNDCDQAQTDAGIRNATGADRTGGRTNNPAPGAWRDWSANNNPNYGQGG